MPADQRRRREVLGPQSLWNGYGQLGSGDEVNALQPVDVADVVELLNVYVPAVFW